MVICLTSGETRRLDLVDFDVVLEFWPSLHISAEALGISPITVKETVHKLRLAVKMCARRGMGQKSIEVYA